MTEPARPSPDAAGPAPWWRSRLLLLAVVCLVFSWAFATFASEVAERELRAFDLGVRGWVVTHRSAPGLALFGAITWLGAMPVVVVVSLLVGTLLVRRGARMRPLLVAVAPFLFTALTGTLKPLFAIGRPPTGAVASSGFSFPSGHATSSMAAAIILGYVLVREGMIPRRALAAGLLLPLLVGASRVYLDYHWTSDVLGGWAVGGAFGTACCALYEHARRRAIVRLHREEPSR